MAQTNLARPLPREPLPITEPEVETSVHGELPLAPLHPSATWQLDGDLRHPTHVLELEVQADLVVQGPVLPEGLVGESPDEGILSRNPQGLHPHAAPLHHGRRREATPEPPRLQEGRRDSPAPAVVLHVHEILQAVVDGAASIQIDPGIVEDVAEERTDLVKQRMVPSGGQELLHEGSQGIRPGGTIGVALVKGGDDPPRVVGIHGPHQGVHAIRQGGKVASEEGVPLLAHLAKNELVRLLGRTEGHEETMASPGPAFRHASRLRPPRSEDGPRGAPARCSDR